ncbi:hypothetical protein GCM10010435_09020 [Winogradskya consettensis]|uniref:Uncharacterized protein n=1 Tax=Winogradskya consettensis TaxID=113560 RepID=A0A919SXQ2_9ACTN|nr:hypothetical protein [Actinoplanes consettensis]GIM80626.1 hypothetical protein Aco04nite_71740 [Actinoplanes consettensis]
MTKGDETDDRVPSDEDPPDIFRGQVLLDQDEKPPLTTGEAPPPAPPKKSS